MNTKIDIKTPAGKSLERFPIEVTNNACYLMSSGRLNLSSDTDDYIVQLHKGDIITIEIL